MDSDRSHRLLKHATTHAEIINQHLATQTLVVSALVDFADWNHANRRQLGAISSRLAHQCGGAANFSLDGLLFAGLSQTHAVPTQRNT